MRRMKKWAGLLALFALFGWPTRAQVTPAYEIAGGYMYLRYYPTGGSRIGMNGWNASFDYNFKRWLGLEGEVAGSYKNQGVNGKSDIYTFLAGPKIYPWKHRKLTPYAHLLFGAGRYKITFPPPPGFPSSSTLSDTAFAFAGGGGVDYKFSKNWAARVAQFDYEATRFFGGSPGQRNYRFSAGIVFYYGEK
jgi:opacity protein-like surface antigen